MKKGKIALIGNQNSGKTTLFNALTGSSQHVGNFPGVTVEQKRGYIQKHNYQYEIIDLPGIYSLSPYSSDEIVAVDFLLYEKPDLILNIIDATNMERSLYLTLQLMELNIPIIIILNMMDEVYASGNSINIQQLQNDFHFPVIPISANKNKGIHNVMKAVEKTIFHSIRCYPLYNGYVFQAMQSISTMIEKKVNQLQLPICYCITKLIEKDQRIIQLLNLDHEEQQQIKNILFHLERKTNLESEVALIDMRYSIIENICQRSVTRKQETKEQIRSEKIDQLLTHPYLGIPIFITIMLIIFYVTFYLIGAPLQNLMEKILQIITQYIIFFLQKIQISDWLLSLINEGVLSGVGSVLSFLPVIVILFFFLSLLEDSGYMARVAFVMDRALRYIGLSGKSIVPMLIGFGCSVPAIMSTRTLSSKRDRYMTIIFIPFMSCSAKLPIYSMMISAFFSSKMVFVMIMIYSIGIFVFIISALLLKNTLFTGDSIPFVLELPAYRLPTLRNIILSVYDRAKDFIHKALTIILLSSILIWFLENFNFQLQMVEESSQSILASIGLFITPLLKPLGFDDWRVATALMTGLTAKETVVSTLTVLTSSSNIISLNKSLMTIFTPLSALSFLTFTALYMPCMAAFAATKRELGSGIKAICVSLFQTGMAYIISLTIYQIGSIFI